MVKARSLRTCMSDDISRSGCFPLFSLLDQEDHFQLDNECLNLCVGETLCGSNKFRLIINMDTYFTYLP